jgi:protein TonB
VYQRFHVFAILFSIKNSIPQPERNICKHRYSASASIENVLDTCYEIRQYSSGRSRFYFYPNPEILMKRTNKLLPITICVSVLIHVGIFLFLTVNSRSHTVSPEQDAVIFSLVNIDIPEPELPPQPEPEPEPAPPPPPLPVEAPPEPEDPSKFIVVEELPPSEKSQSASVEIPAVSPATATGKAQTAAQPAQKTGDTAAVGAYIKGNYSYISRRIRDKMVYPPPARRAGIQGVVEIAFTIYLDGKVGEVKITVSSGQESLDKAAIAAIHAAAPFPRPPAQARLSIPVAFRLK